MYFHTFNYLSVNRDKTLPTPNHDIEYIGWQAEKLNINLLNVEGKGYCLHFPIENQRIYLKNLPQETTEELKKTILNSHIISVMLNVNLE